MQYYYKTSKGEVVELFGTTPTIFLFDKDIVEIVVPPCKRLDISKNKLTKLVIPEGVLQVTCNMNSDLEDLELPDSLQMLKCKECKLYKPLVLPKSLEVLECDYNPLEKIDFSKNVEIGHITCKGCNIKELTIPKDVNYLNASNNYIKKFVLPVNSECLRLVLDNNELTELILDSKKLEKLECEGNELTNIDVYKCLALRELDCRENKLTEVLVPDNLKRLISEDNPTLKKVTLPLKCMAAVDKTTEVLRRKQAAPSFGGTDKAISDLILKIKNPTLRSIADQLTKNIPNLTADTVIDIKTIKKLANSNPTLGQMLTKKEGQTLIKANSAGFAISVIYNADFFNGEALCQNKFIEIAHDKWTGAQIYFEDKINHVFQINLKAFKTKELVERNKNLQAYVENSNHPTSKKLLTIAWVRYTYLEDKNAIVIDEIQTDLDDDKF